MGALFSILAMLGLLEPGVLARPQPQSDPCEDFQRALASVPHVSLTRRDGDMTSTWDGHDFRGCQIDFETNDSTLAGASVPQFWADDPDSDMYRAGWRTIPEILADGAGSGVYGVARRGTRCVVRWEQPAYIDDDGTFVQSETFDMLIQCEPPPEP